MHDTHPHSPDFKVQAENNTTHTPDAPTGCHVARKETGAQRQYPYGFARIFAVATERLLTRPHPDHIGLEPVLALMLEA